MAPDGGWEAFASPEITMSIRLVVMPDLDQQAIGASDVIFQPFHSQAENVQSLAARAQRRPFLRQLAANADVLQTVSPRPSLCFGRRDNYRRACWLRQNTPYAGADRNP